MMKVFDGKSAAEEYMSTHTLNFSTPEMTLKKFAVWLSEIVENNGEGGTSNYTLSTNKRQRKLRVKPIR